MFDSVLEMLEKFTPKQRIFALLIVVVSIILITLGPSVIKGSDCKDVYEELEIQRKELLRLNKELVDVQINANNERLEREREIAKIVDMIKTDADNCPLCDHIHLTPYEKDLVKLEE